jgi:F-type H+-transporting ATPase subunit b
MLTETHLRMPDATLLVEIGAFLLVLAVVAKFVVPRLRAAIDARQAGIAAAFTAADAAQRRRDALDAECRGLLAAARHQARLITDEGRATKDYLIAEGRREGQAEYEWRAGRFDRERTRQSVSAGRHPVSRCAESVVGREGEDG